MRAWGYKLIITLMWLAVPVIGWYFACADYQQYKRDGTFQRVDCTARADILGRYTILLGNEGTELLQVESEMDLFVWETKWQGLQLQYKTERGLLRNTTPTHYPNADTQLNKLEGLIVEQQELINQANVRRRQYIQAEDGLLAVQRSVSEVESAAQYYKRINAEGIYLLLMEDLAKLEDRFRQLQRHRRDLQSEAEAAIRDADENCRAIQRELKRLPDNLDGDENVTYIEALLLRFEHFDPWSELRQGIPAVSSS